MRGKVERGLRGVPGGGGDHAHPAATSGQVRKSRCPSRLREGGQDNPFMPGLRIREDGWTGARTRTFLALLAQTGFVADAARARRASAGAPGLTGGEADGFGGESADAVAAGALRFVERLIGVGHQR